MLGPSTVGLFTKKGEKCFIMLREMLPRLLLDRPTKLVHPTACSPPSLAQSHVNMSTVSIMSKLQAGDRQVYEQINQIST